MTTVFVLTQSEVTDSEGYTIDSADVLGVFATEQKAQAALDEFAILYNYGRSVNDYYIQEEEVR